MGTRAKKNTSKEVRERARKIRAKMASIRRLRIQVRREIEATIETARRRKPVRRRRSA